MSISPIFVFAPIPLTNEQSPLAHAAALARRRQLEATGGDAPMRYRISPKKVTEAALAR